MRTYTHNKSYFIFRSKIYKLNLIFLFRMARYLLRRPVCYKSTLEMGKKECCAEKTWGAVQQNRITRMSSIIYHKDGL